MYVPGNHNLFSVPSTSMRLTSRNAALLLAKMVVLYLVLKFKSRFSFLFLSSCCIALDCQTSLNTVVLQGDAYLLFFLFGYLKKFNSCRISIHRITSQSRFSNLKKNILVQHVSFSIYFSAVLQVLVEVLRLNN